MMKRTNRKQARRWPIRQRAPVALVLLLLMISLAGCCEPTTTSVPLTLTPLPPPPSAPVTAPTGPDITVQAGKQIAIRASAMGVDGYRWELRGSGEISTTGPGDTTLYTAPEQVGPGGTMAQLLVTAYNESGESPQTSLVINVIPPTPTPVSPPTITITSPLTEAVCPLNEECCFNVIGTSSGVVSDPNLQVIVFVRDGDWWFPHKWVTFESDGTWQRKTQIGSRSCWSVGYPFEIVAMVFTQAVAAEFPSDFQSLPENYVAQSNRVTLVTTYEPVPIDLLESVPHHDPKGIDAITITTVSDHSLIFDYHLGGGWVQVEIPVNPEEMACMKDAGFSIAFSRDGTGAANTFEVKLEDPDSTSCVWRMKSVTDGPEMVKLSLARPFDECWGGDGELDWQKVRKITFAVSQHPEDEGHKGQMVINDLTMTPFTLP